ncbi:MAG: hypothetical protein K0R50_3350, partial [Eubacterium sp.]|nr:hypothetical protein [Eubacterium sp.]
MQNSMDELSQRMSLLSDESLREIAEGSREDYEEYAVDLARKELESRQILKSPVLSTFKDLILSVSFDEAKEDIILKFPEKMPHIDALREVFDTLHATQTSGHNSDFLHIKTDETSSIALGEDAQTGERYGV